MDENPDEGNPFQDLLSAALSESGLTDDFDISGFTGDEQNEIGVTNVTASQAYGPTVQNVLPQNVASSATVRTITKQSLPDTPRTIRAMAGGATPVVRINARGQPVVQPGVPLNSTGSLTVKTVTQASRLVTPVSGATIVRLNAGSKPVVLNSVPRTQASVVSVAKQGVTEMTSNPTADKVKKGIIHIVTPKNATGGNILQDGTMIKQVLQGAGSSSGNLHQPAKPGTIKVIQIAAPKTTTSSSQNVVTLAGGDGKTYKIVSVKSVSRSSLEGAGQKITMAPSAIVSGGLPRNVVRMLPGKTGAPLRATIVTTSNAGSVTTPIVVSQHQAPRALTSQGVSSPPIGAVSSAQPIIIRTPKRTESGNLQPGKTVTKVLKIVRPPTSSISDGEVPTKIVRLSAPVSKPTTISTGQSRISVAGGAVQFGVQSSQPATPSRHIVSTVSYVISASSPLHDVIARSQGSHPVTVSPSTTVLSTASTSNIASSLPGGGVNDQELRLVTSSPSCTVLSASSAGGMAQSTPTPIKPVTLDDIVAAKSEDEKLALDALNDLCDGKPSIGQNAEVKPESSVLDTIKVEPMENDAPGPTSETKIKTESEPAVEIPDIKAEVKMEVKTEIKSEKDEVKTEVKTEAKTEVKTEVKTEENTVENTEAKMEADNKDVEDTLSPEWDSFGGTDLYLFSQAIQQLAETNKKAKEFEEQAKKQVDPEPPAKEISTAPTPPPQENLLKTAVEASNIQPTTEEINSGVSAPFQGVEIRKDITSSGRSSPIIHLTQPGQVHSPVTIVQRVGSPLTLSRPGSPNILFQQPQKVSLIQTANGQSIICTTASMPGSGVTQGTTIRRISALPQMQTTGAFVTTPSGQVVHRVLHSGPRITIPAGVPIPGAQKVTVGSINQLPFTSVPRSVAGNGTIPTKLTDKIVSHLWANDDLKLRKIATAPSLTRYQMSSTVVPSSAIVDEEIEVEEEDLGHAETYAEYMPPKLKIGQKHPDPVVETSSLSSVEPPGVFYRLSIPEHIIDSGALSALQLEAIVYACQKHETFLPSGDRAGFLVGDGAGVGKGRTIAGMIYENYLQGRKRALWLSVSNDLKVDAERDLHDIGAGKIEVHPLNKFKYAKISSHVNNRVKKGVIFATYSSLIGESQAKGKYRTRLKQLLHWAGKDFDGIIVFDECHRAKNLCPVGGSKPTKTGLTVLELQKKLPKARVVYASATGASEPRNMAYMTRLGMWGLGTPFREFTDFIQAVEKRGVGAMELVAMDMKLRGMYIARQLSFKGVSFSIKEIEIPREFVQIYDASVKLWVEAREKFQKAAELISAEHRMRKTMWGQFWSAHQRFFKYLCISAKVNYCVKIARDAVKNGKCVVIGLQSTGEARTLEQLEECGGELNDFVSTAKGVLQTLVEKHFPAPDRRKTMDLFGWNSSIFNDSPVPSPKAPKRKKAQKNNDKKRSKTDWSDDSSSDSNDSDDNDDSSDDAKSDKSSKSASEESSLSLSESSSEDSDEESDNFNPFGDSSDSDEDPWLKKAKKSKDKKKKKALKEKKKEEKTKKKKKDKKHKEKKKPDSDSDDEFDDIDSQLDKMLVSAGLKKASSFSSSVANQIIPAKDSVQQAIDMKRDLLNKIEKLGDILPPNTLDELIDQLGGPDYVAEMTGRKGRVVSTDDGSVQYESRSESDTPLELMNLAEKQRFMNGDKLIAIISEAASSGISLQADRRVANQRRRVHITLELPWSADRAIQQFGRTHRSNQVSAPEYIFLISQLAGEQRFASTVAKRLESLGALTHGDRRATETRDLSRFNIDNKFGRAALETVMKSVLQQEVPMVPPPESYHGNFFADVKRGLVGVGMIAVDERTGLAVLEKEYNNISKFLNRILGMEVELQNELFKYFTSTLTAVILQAKRNGRWDMGILDLGTGDEEIKTLSSKTFKGNFSGCNTRVTLYTVSLERGITWQKAIDLWRQYDGSDDGFYLSKENMVQKRPAILAIAMIGRKRERLYRIYRPNTGVQSRLETLEEIKKKYKKVYPNDARESWEDQYNASLTICTHAYWRGSCRRAAAGMTCEAGLRRRTYHILSGSVLSVWTKVESVLASTPGGVASRMQIIRLRTEDGKKIVGTIIPAQALMRLEQMLSASAAESPQKQVTYTPHISKPNPVLFSHVSSGSKVTRPMPQMTFSTVSTSSCTSSKQSSGQSSSVPSSENSSETTSKQYLSMPMFL